MKKLRLYTLDDYNTGLKPTCTRNGFKVDFIKHYPDNSPEGDEFSCVLEDGSFLSNLPCGRRILGKESTLDLMIEEDYQVKDWVITEGYSPNYDGKALRITRIEDYQYAYFEPYLEKDNYFILG